MAHSPAPWRIEPRSEDIGGFTIEVGRDEFPVAIVPQNRRPASIAAANAALIAGAPELLAVCQALESHCRVETPETRGNAAAHTAKGQKLRARLQAAIATATGAT